MRLLLDAGADSPLSGKLEMIVLHWVVRFACQGETDAGVVRLLLERGADISEKNEYGCTPLIVAVMVEAEEPIELENLEVVKVLV